MLDTDRDAFAEVIAGVYEFYGKGDTISEFSLGVWWQAMQRYDLAAVRDALGRHCMNPDSGQWLPKPADVVRMLDGGTLDSAQVAWAKVQRAVESVGSYQSVCFDDATINAVLADMGGWIALGAVKLDELPFRQKEFENRYRAYRLRGRLEAYPRALPGIIARDNGAKGHQAPEPVLYGDAGRAALVYQGGRDGTALSMTPLAKALPKPQESAAV